MKEFIMYDVDRHEKIAEAYDEFMCQDMLWAFWDHGINNIQIQMVELNKEGEEQWLISME